MQSQGATRVTRNTCGRSKGGLKPTGGLGEDEGAARGEHGASMEPGTEMCPAAFVHGLAVEAVFGPGMSRGVGCCWLPLIRAKGSP